MDNDNKQDDTFFHRFTSKIKKYIDSQFEYMTISTGFLELPVRQAMKENRIKTIKDLLLKEQFGVDEYVIKPSQHTMLHEAIILNRKEIFSLCMLYHGTITPLHLSNSFFISANPEIPDSNGVTPLIKAASLGRCDMVKILLERGADKDRKGPDGKTAMEKAQLFERWECIEVLKNPQAELTKKRKVMDRFGDN